MDIAEAGRSEALAAELVSVRSSLATARLRLEEVTSARSKEYTQLEAQMEARLRGELLARSRCEAAELEVKELRGQ